MKKQFKRFSPYLIFIVVALLVLLPQITTKSFLAGDDSFFHMNRFYDAAMQIKTGKFNYFQTNFGFQQTGRIINALYGPIFAYLNGLLLLIMHGWIRYEIASSFLILVGSASIMDWVGRKLNLSSGMSFLIGILYMLSNPINAWVFSQQFTGWGAMLMPILLLAGIKMVQNGDVKVLTLAIPMSLLLQVHVLSSLIGVLALIPFFIAGLIKSEHRTLMVKHVSLAVILTILLTGNIWSALLDVMGSNHLMPVFPVFDMDAQAIGFQSYALHNVLNPAYIFIVILIILILVLNWRKLAFPFKVTSSVGIFFIWLSSSLFPWNTLAKIFPSISDTIQFPKRFIAVGLSLLLLSIGYFLTNFKLIQRKQLFTIVIALIMVAPLIDFNAKLNAGVSTWQSSSVIPKYNILMVYAKNRAHLRHDYQSRKLTRVLNAVVKPSPDYLPIKHPLAANQYTAFRPYHLTHYTLVKANHHLKHYRVHVKSNGELAVKWYNPNQTSRQRVQLIKYRHSVIKENGKRLHHVKTNQIGVMTLTSKHGWNHVTLAYQPRKIFIFASLAALCSWLIMLGFVIIRKFKQN
ncbi:hypothetical protein WR164_12380 [Philodulcilactobacillus myokoensis]|uniref:Cell division protein n=1 Tax=Philodulcilactobacillus myokoensis TaxID=2929573 RepID=A0A9W6ETX2_9LACO|nr:hypothetical protein [Philodulcilactobacillus myokoensis]GLB47259.1 hypothetical protein WR164_12380 [Philodulcilactobacillus myokoensis]